VTLLNKKFLKNEDKNAQKSESKVENKLTILFFSVLSIISIFTYIIGFTIVLGFKLLKLRILNST
jgi:hypothetical protein